MPMTGNNNPSSGAYRTSSRTPSPPQFINEVEVTNEETSVAQFSVEDIVNEAEIPASMEEVIATATTGWPSSTKKATNPTRTTPPAK